jgi:hypothetical protein
MGTENDALSSSPSFEKAATEGQWSIALGGIPINLNLENKGLGLLSFADEWANGTNHNYIEIRGPNDEVFRRIQAQEANMGAMGDMMGASYGSEYVSFGEDQIYHDDAHDSIPNMLRSGDDPEQTATIFTGTKDQVLTLYHQAITGVVELNNQDQDYNALWGNNGNTFAAEILEVMHDAARTNGYVAPTSFDPKGDDAGFDSSVFDIQPGHDICYNDPDQLLAAIDTIEEKIGEQYQAITIDGAEDVNVTIPAEAALGCHLGLK